ncbi:MAG: hypothetical protein AB7I30_03105 [Isosphaeraceae bacterium]
MGTLCALRWRSSIWAVLIGAVLIFVPSLASADPINVGNILIDKYEGAKTATQGGINLIAHYTLNAAFGQFSDCFTAADVRWLQRVTSSAPTGFTPDPNRPFIDPRVGQAGGPFDNLPWYDFTYNTLANLNTDTNRQNGAGPWYTDNPRVNLNRGPYTFFAETLVVVQKNQMISILGGFSWGFSIGADQMTVTSLPITPLQDNAGLRASFNAALGVDYPGYTIKDFGDIWPNLPGTPTINTIPEPHVLQLAALGGGLLLLTRLRRAKAA